jgi:hypothetical protein
MKLPKEMSTGQNDAGILINFIKDVEANAERESGERILGKIQNRKAGFCSFRKFGPWLKLVKDDEEKNLPV